MEITRNMGRFQIAQNDSLQLFHSLIFNQNNGIANIYLGNFLISKPDKIE
jgi:hypothetical protein